MFVASYAAYDDHSTVSFDGTDDYLDLNGSMITVDSFTLFIVGNFDSDALANQYMISAQGGSGDDRLRVAHYTWIGGEGFMTRVGYTGDKNLRALSTNATVIAVTDTADAWIDLGDRQTVGANTAGALFLKIHAG